MEMNHGQSKLITGNQNESQGIKKNSEEQNKVESYAVKMH